MGVYAGVQAALGGGCTTVVVPGWAAIAVVMVAAAPRLARELRGPRGEGGS